MRIFVTRIFIFTSLLGLLNFGYLILVRELDNNFSKRIESLSFDNPDFDILVLGNSLALDGIDTKYLSENGFSAYNLALGGASIKSSIVQLQEYLDSYENKPEVVILGLGSYLDHFRSEQVHPVIDFTRKAPYFGISDIPMIKFKWMFKELLKRIVSAPHRDAKVVLGQLKFAKQIPDISKENPDNKFKLEQYTESELIQDMIKICSDHDILLFVIEMPGYSDTRHTELFDYYILDKEKNNGILLDYNTIEFGSIFDKNTDWIGNSHLNVYGARKFTEILLERMNEFPINTKIPAVGRDSLIH